MTANDIRVQKYSGELKTFDLEKLRVSLYKSGATKKEVNEVLEQMQPKIYDGISSKELYKLAFSLLKRVNNSLAARYSLKRALRDLGPAGYYFEQWFAKFLSRYGYDTSYNQIIQGHAVTHEADVIAKRGEDVFWIECKFRNTVDAKISVTTPMYLLSRVNDIKGKSHQLFGKETEFTQGWLVTNAYLTSDSIAFGNFYGLKLLSWDYPIDRGLKHLVDKKALYPVTCLTTLTIAEKNKLLEKKCILVHEILENDEAVASLNLDNRRRKRMLVEVKELIYIHQD